VRGEDVFDWQRGKGQKNAWTGPKVDHTTNTALGYYAYIDPTYLMKLGDNAFLVSEIVSLDGTACLEWYMHLYGSNIGNLTVYQRFQKTDIKSATNLFQVNGQKGQAWIRGRANLIVEQSPTKFFEIIFEATAGRGSFGNIALDDIRLIKGGTCEYLDATTLPPTTTAIPSTTKLECNFEQGFCEWYPEPSGPSIWQRQNGQAAIFGSAPLNDVTFQNSLGYYAFINTASASSGVAVLRSPKIVYNQVTCLDFWYQLGGPINSKLSVSLLNLNKNKSEIWSRNGNRADTWTRAFVRFSNNLNNEWIEFDGSFLFNFNFFFLFNLF
jgi:hypothetical protein